MDFFEELPPSLRLAKQLLKALLRPSNKISEAIQLWNGEYNKKSSFRFTTNDNKKYSECPGWVAKW